MKKPSDTKDELRDEYDLAELLSGAVRGKYVQRNETGTNLVLLDPDIAAAFPDAKPVNAALRLVMQLSKIPALSAKQDGES
jgi:hypothetical protein